MGACQCKPRRATEDAITPAVGTEAVDVVNRLGVEAVGSLLSAPGSAGSVFLSPLSLGLALAMTANGARAGTQEGILRAICAQAFSGCIGNLNQQLKGLAAALASTDPQVTFRLANAIWSAGISEKFASLCRDMYNAEARAEKPQAGPINAWCNEQTEGKIRVLLNPSAPLDPGGAVIANALYFKGAWKDKFDERLTVDEEFHSPSGRCTCKMMTAKGDKGKFLYRETDTYQAAVLPYGAGGEYSAVLLLPRAGPEPTYSGFAGPAKGAAAGARAATLAEVLGALPKDWPSLAQPSHSQASKLEPAKGSLHLPRFQAEYGTSLKDLLAERGMKEAFQGGADFGALGEGQFQLTDVVHKTFLEVNEQGTEAAAATAVIVSRSLDMDPSFAMTCSRPFLFLIRHNSSNALVFVGAVVTV